MSAYRCSLCGINYPERSMFTTCPVHDEPTDAVDKHYDVDWEIKAAVIMRRVESDEEARVWGPLLDVAIIVRDQGFFVNAWDVYHENGNSRLFADGLFRVGKMTFEVIAYLDEAREYWVRPFEVTASDEGLSALLGSG